MALDPSIILQGRGIQLDNPIETQNKLAQLQQARNQNRLADLTFSDNQRERAGENSLSQLLADGKSGDDVVRGLASQGYGARGLAYGKQFQDQRKTAAEIDAKTADVGKTKADTGKSLQETAMHQFEIAGQLANAWVNNPGVTKAQIQSGLNAAAHSGVISPQVAQAKLDELGTIGDDPKSLNGWANGVMAQVMKAKDAMAYIKPDANAVLTSNTARANTRYSADSSARTAGARLAFDKSKEEGNTPTDLSEATVDAIGQYRQNPPTAYALRNPKIANLMDRVNAKYPSFDATEYAAKQKAMRDFSTGTPGNSIRSFSTATDHLTQLDQLVDALGNGNVPLANKISNLVAQNTGSTAPTNFDAVKGIVAKEVLKSIVAGGGGVEERQELSHLLDNAKTTKQLKGVIGGYLHLMSAQKDNLEQQYELSTGRKDAKTRFNYKKEAPTVPNPVAPAASTVPSDIDALLKKHGGK